MRVFERVKYIRVIITVILSIIVAVCFVNFQRDSKKIIEDASTQSLKDLAEIYASVFQMKIRDQISMLEAQARYFTDIDMNDYSSIKKTILDTKGIGEFKRVAVANKFGMTINSNGTSSGNISLEDYFQQVMSTGKAQVAKDIKKDEDGEDVLIVAVPIIQMGKAEGVVTGTFSRAILANLFSVDSFNSEGYSDVVTIKGQMIVSSSETFQFAEKINLFDYVLENEILNQIQVNQVKSDMYLGRSNIVNIGKSLAERICYYTPIGVNNWYVFSYVPANYIISMQRRISSLVYMLVGVLVIVLIFVLIAFIELNKENREVRNDVERFAIASEQNQSCVFEYDIKTKKIHFTGNYQYAFGKIHNPIDLNDFRKMYVNIHEDDQNITSHINEFFAQEQDTFTAELRYKCFNGDYRWFRLSGTSIKDKDGSPFKFVGNFTNVDAQMMHEQELRHIAETDLLSGLYNKSFFQKNVTKFLNTANEATVGALFIIDLDNFKQTNDTLGHAMGDMAIRDTAQKISLIFSQKDILGRIGGDEFCVFMILDNISENMFAKILMEKAASLNEILQEYYNNDMVSVQVSASIGISLFPRQGNNYSDLFHHADSALYYVKQNGKNGNAIYTDKMKNGEETNYV
ncbi:MAG: diguanylate cyclase [Treponema sp.]|nr:diguanylate cyclase [Treponema sp.]